MSMTDSSIRVRFAPSPTGFLHVGGARTAIFNWLWARHTNGTFVLRIENTDEERSTRESEASLLEDLRWLGLDWDEGPDVGGECGPYRQTDRLETYKTIARKFVETGLAYPCFCTDEDLERKRQAALADSRPPRYDGICRTLTPEQVAEKRAAGMPDAIRFQVPGRGFVRFEDVVRGPMELDHLMVGDFVIVRSNGLPTYNYAAAVDDHHMGITHVIRGEEHLSNTLRQILIYDAIGAAHPMFVHVPLILAEDRSKLSKRHGSASVGELRARGFVASAVVNYLLLLGWSHPESKEIMTRDEMIAAFEIDRIGKAAGVLDPQKLVWMNGQHVRAFDPSELCSIAASYLPDWITENYDASARREIVEVLQDSIETLDGLPELCKIFADPVELEDDAREVLAQPASHDLLQAFEAVLSDLAGPMAPEDFKSLAKLAGKTAGRKGRELFFPLRAAITGNVHGPDLSKVASIKGSGSVSRLIRAALEGQG